jgi:hypothetical protein
MKGESTALVGEPHVGSTSLLLKLSDPDTLGRYLGAHADRFTFSYLEFLGLEEDFTASSFWAEALEPLERDVNLDVTVREALLKAAEAAYARRPMMQLFRLLGRRKRPLVLLLDEFDCLLQHRNFQSHQFFATLRRLASHSQGLVVITASRWPLARMQSWGRQLHPSGSSLFSHMISVRLSSFEERYVVELLDWAGDRFDDADRQFIRRIAGRNPFLVQAAASVMLETGDTGLARLTKAGTKFYERIDHHFYELWSNLDDNARTAAVILSLMELGGRAPRGSFAFGEIEQVQNFGPELSRLNELGLAERVGRKGWQFDTEHLLFWQGERWTVAAQAFTWWVRDVVIAGQRPLPTFDEWLADHRYVGVVTQEQWDRLLNAVRSLPDWAGRGVGVLAGSLAQELLKRLTPGL